MQKGPENSLEAGNQSEKPSGGKQNHPKNSESPEGGEMGQATVCGVGLR